MPAKKSKTTLHLSLEGKIFLIEKKGKKTVRKDELDGKLCVTALRNVIEDAIKNYCGKDELELVKSSSGKSKVVEKKSGKIIGEQG